MNKLKIIFMILDNQIIYNSFRKFYKILQVNGRIMKFKNFISFLKVFKNKI